MNKCFYCRTFLSLYYANAPCDYLRGTFTQQHFPNNCLQNHTPAPTSLLRLVFQAKYFGSQLLYFTGENIVNLCILLTRGLLLGKLSVHLKHHSHAWQNYAYNLGFFLLSSPHNFASVTHSRSALCQNSKVKERRIGS